MAPAGDAAYDVMPPAIGTGAEYLIGPLDELSMRVFREPDFENDRIAVDANGFASFPLIGLVEVGGKTAHEVAKEIARRLDERYLVDPQVSITVVTANSQQVTVEGEVNKAGIFPIRGRSSLMQVTALAEGTNEFAKLNEVVIFRTINGERFAARFDLEAIRGNRAPDPEVIGGDIVVVGYSSARRLWRDVLQVLPSAAGIFVAVQNRN
jgi:polysaccharide export outer membrane protein